MKTAKDLMLAYLAGTAKQSGALFRTKTGQHSNT